MMDGTPNASKEVEAKVHPMLPKPTDKAADV